MSKIIYLALVQFLEFELRLTVITTIRSRSRGLSLRGQGLRGKKSWRLYLNPVLWRLLPEAQHHLL